MTYIELDRSNRLLLCGDADAELVVRDLRGELCGPQQIGVLWASSVSEPKEATQTELLGITNERGQIFSLGRRADAIGTAFGWLTPREGEVLLESHPAVAEAVLVTLTRDAVEALGYELAADFAPDADSGAGFFAVVVLEDVVAPGSPLVELELLEFCSRKLSAAKCPIGLVLSDSLPRDPDGDFDRAALQALVLQQVSR